MIRTSQYRKHVFCNNGPRCDMTSKCQCRACAERRINREAKQLGTSQRNDIGSREKSLLKRGGK